MATFVGWALLLLFVVAALRHWLVWVRRSSDSADPAITANEAKPVARLTAPLSVLPPSDAADRYELREVIGQGGMGVVRKAYDRTLRRFVAIKSLAGAPEDDVRAARFVREARVLATLNDPNIVAVYDVFVSATLGRCIVMELVSGESLRAIMQSGPLPIDTTLGYATQLSGALARVHETGIVHRDLKPDNIMITTDGTLKILDFGIALMGARPFWPLPHEDSRVTESGTLVGTPSYMSPEQIRGEEVDSRTDVFSFGCVLYEMIAGRGPFVGGSVAVVFDAILNHAAPGFASLGITVPPALEALVFDALVKERFTREISMAKLRRELLRIRDGEEKGTPGRVAPGAQQEIAPARVEATEYLYVDHRRLDLYYRQLAPLHSAAGGIAVEDQIRILIDGLQAHQQLSVVSSGMWAQDFVAVSIDRGKTFYIEVVEAVPVWLRPRAEHDFGGLKIWVSGESSSSRTGERTLYLIEDAPTDNWVGESFSGFSALLMIGRCIRGSSTADSFMKCSREAEAEFSRDPVAYLQSLGAQVGAARLIRTLYRTRAVFVDLRGPTTVGYPIVISEWTPGRTDAGTEVAGSGGRAPTPGPE